MLVGVFLSTVLYGMFTYLEKSSKRDSIWTRGLVLCLFLCITLNTAFDMVAVYQPLLQQFGTSICITIEASFKLDVSQFSELRIVIGIIWLVSSAIADLIITGVLIYSLHVRKSGCNTSLDAYVNRIIRSTAQTGALTTIFALTDALVFVILKVFHLSLGLALPYFYISTILSSLNARDSWINRENVLLPASSNDIRSQSGSKFWGSMALQNPARIDIEMQPELNGEMGVQRNDL
ncbi:hypothetical protein C8J56DRAFT_972587, partial [Mycena floridula]